MTYRQGIDVDDHEVEGHREGHGAHQPEVAPGRHPHQGLVLRQAEWFQREGLLMSKP